MNACQRKIIINETRVCDGITYKYSLIESTNLQISCYKIPLYSVRIEMLIHENESFSENESVALFSDLNKATDFYYKLVSNLATPMNLPYIIEDELSV